VIIAKLGEDRKVQIKGRAVQKGKQVLHSEGRNELRDLSVR
jgi:hypothetical protein